MGGADSGSEESKKAQDQFPSVFDASGRDPRSLHAGKEEVGRVPGYPRNTGLVSLTHASHLGTSLPPDRHFFF